RVLAGKARCDRLRCAHREVPGPARENIRRHKVGCAKPAHAHARQPEPGLDAAGMICAAVDDGLPARTAEDTDAKLGGLLDHAVGQLPGASVEAEGLHQPAPSAAAMV